MIEKLKRISKKMAIYGLLIFLGLPSSLVLGNIEQVHAAASKTAAHQKTVSPIPVEKEKLPKMAFIGNPTGLHRANTYVAGQSIKMNVLLQGEPIKVWAEVGILDPNFPERIDFLNKGQGNWTLATPKFADDLDIGEHLVKIVAQNNIGQTVQYNQTIVLQKFTALKIISYKVFGNNTATIDWGLVSWADVYEVSWQIQGDDLSAKSMRTKLNSVELIGLEPGSFYEVSIQSLRGDAVSKAKKVVFKTLGEKTIKKTVDKEITVPEVKKITPAIDKGVTTYRPPSVVKTPEPIADGKGQVSPVAPSPVPTVSPSPSVTPSAAPAPTQTGGWSKFLIALSILIIAAGAAIGGYYGYEWLVLRSKDKEPPTDSSSRW